MHALSLLSTPPIFWRNTGRNRTIKGHIPAPRTVQKVFQMSSRKDDYVKFDKDGVLSESQARQQQSSMSRVTDRAQCSDYYDIQEIFIPRKLGL